MSFSTVYGILVLLCLVAVWFLVRSSFQRNGHGGTGYGTDCGSSKQTERNGDNPHYREE